MTFIEGRIQRFVRSGFSRLPSAEFEAQWQMLARNLWSRESTDESQGPEKPATPIQKPE